MVTETIRRVEQKVRTSNTAQQPTDATKNRQINRQEFNIAKKEAAQQRTEARLEQQRAARHAGSPQSRGANVNTVA